MYYDLAACGKRIRELRISHDLKQEAFSLHLNISDSHLRKIEAGIHGGSIDVLVEIAKYFDVTMDYLILGRRIEEEVVRKRIASAISILNSCLD